MATVLPYRATTASGDHVDIVFPLHPQTAAAVRVSQMLSSILGVLDGELKLDPTTSNGDVLQALVMALAIRASIIEAPTNVTGRLALDLVSAALDAMNDAERSYTHLGRA